jgi:type VI secretion system protein ImpJ
MGWANKVIWSEGMFLRPAHFQQHVRYVENLVERRCGVLRSHPWGFKTLKLDEALLSLGKVAIVHAQGVFPDGTPFNISDDDDPPPPLDVAQGDVRDMVVRLGLPVRRTSAMEINPGNAAAGLVRCTVREVEAVDTHTAAAERAALQVGQLNLKLCLDRDGHGEMVSLGVARIVECRDDKSVMLDDAYLPPALDCRAAPALFSMVTELQGLLHQRAEALAGRITAAGRGGVSEVADFLLLQVVNRHEPLIAHLGSAGSLHPETFYAQAVALAGELATFTHPGKRPPVFPPYRHEDTQSAFRAVMAELRRSLSAVLEQNALPLPLEERKYGIRVSAIADRTLLESASFVLAVRAHMPAEELRKRFPAQVKIGPVEQIRQLVNVQLPGIGARPLAVAPRQLPYHSGFVYFELDRASEFWAGLGNSGGFAIHLSGEFPGLEMEFWAIRD